MTGRTELYMYQGNVTGLYNRDSVIGPFVVPYAGRHGNASVFLDDNARANRARVVQSHLQFRRTTAFQWPAKFQDMSPVEGLWDILRRRVRRRPH